MKSINYNKIQELVNIMNDCGFHVCENAQRHCGHLACHYLCYESRNVVRYYLMPRILRDQF